MELEKRFRGEGHEVKTWSRGQDWSLNMNWDVFIIALGTMKPIGKFFEVNIFGYWNCVHSNIIVPLEILRKNYKNRNPDSTVVFFAGNNPNSVMPNYSAYTASKIMLTKMAECLDKEEDTKFVILGPGKVKTKIQNQTLKAREKAGENYEAVKEFMKHGKGISHDEVYEFVKTIISYPKDLVGGRNISIRDDWRNIKFTKYNQWKLRRDEGF